MVRCVGREDSRYLLALLALLALAFPATVGAQEDENSFKLAAGTTVEVRLMNTLSTRSNQEGDPFTGHIVEPIFYKGQEVIPVGSILEGRVTYAKEPGRIKGRAEMRLLAETITTPQEVKYTIVAGLEDARGAEGAQVKDEEGTIKGAGTSKKEGAIQTGVGAGAGAAVGAIVAGGKGGLYGAGIGALAAGIRHLAKRGKDVTLPIGTELTFVISRDSIARRMPAAGSNEPAEPDPEPPELKRKDAGSSNH